MPVPRPLLAAVLPVVHARSLAEAWLLVQHLMAHQRQQLYTFAVCLVHTAVVVLPPDLVARLLVLAGEASMPQRCPSCSDWALVWAVLLPVVPCATT